MKNYNLNESEFNLMCDALNGNPKMELRIFPDSHWSKKDLKTTPHWREELITDIFESIELHRLDEKWDVDKTVLADKLFEAIEANEFTGILKRVELFWSKKYPLGKIQNN